mmetsp:Transcript_41696/g.75726  ORF Transcript_41696/g.75726 Transcript_41696/m.75726 type:complete len:269 (-) Transcript_41696:15-821(-)
MGAAFPCSKLDEDDVGDIPLARLAGSQLRERLKYTDLMDLIREEGGIIQVLDFLPDATAREAFRRVQSIQDHEWAESVPGGDIVPGSVGERYGFASFTFWCYSGVKVDPVRRAILELCPNMSDGLDGFQAAKYNKGHHIKPHDDFLSYVQDGDHRTASGKVFPSGTTMFRNLAIVYYLVPDWVADYGGCLIDHGCPSGPRTIVPVFNSLVAFLVPRQHEVSQVVGTGPERRYSVFGWFADSTPTPEASKAVKALEEESDGYELGFLCS